MNSKQETKELETDVKLLLECLKYQSDNQSATKQALVTLATILANHDTIKDYFRENGGLDFILTLLTTTRYTNVKEVAMFCLGNSVVKNVHSQKILTIRSTFSFLHRILSDDDAETRLKQTASYLILCLVSNSGTGQTMARQSSCLEDLLDIFRNSLPKNLPSEKGDSETWFEEMGKTDLGLWSSVTSTLSMCVNNPQNVDNQDICVSLVPFALQLLQRYKDHRVARPVLSLIGLTTASNVSNQDRIRRCGGLDILVTCLEKLISQRELTDTRLSLAVCVTSALDSCISDNENSVMKIGDLGAIPLLIQLLSSPDLSEEERLRVVITIGHTADYSKRNQELISGGPGLPCLIRQLTEAGDEELSKAIKYVLQTCINKTPEKKSPDSDNDEYMEGENNETVNVCSAKINEQEILKRIDKLASQLKILEEQYPSEASAYSSPHRQQNKLNPVKKDSSVQHLLLPTQETEVEQIPMTPNERTLLAELSKEKEERKKLESLTQSLKDDIDKTKTHMENIERQYMPAKTIPTEELGLDLLQGNAINESPRNIKFICSTNELIHPDIPLKNLSSNSKVNYIQCSGKLQPVNTSVMSLLVEQNSASTPPQNSCNVHCSQHKKCSGCLVNPDYSDSIYHCNGNIFTNNSVSACNNLQGQLQNINSSKMPANILSLGHGEMSTTLCQCKHNCNENSCINTANIHHFVESSLTPSRCEESSLTRDVLNGGTLSKCGADLRMNYINGSEPIDLTTRSPAIEDTNTKLICETKSQFPSNSSVECRNIITPKSKAISSSTKILSDNTSGLHQIGDGKKWPPQMAINVKSTDDALFVKPLAPALYRTPRAKSFDVSFVNKTVSPYYTDSSRYRNILPRKLIVNSPLCYSSQKRLCPIVQKENSDTVSEFDFDLFKVAGSMPQDRRTDSRNTRTSVVRTPVMQKITRLSTQRCSTNSNCRIVKRKVEDDLENLEEDDVEVFLSSQSDGLSDDDDVDDKSCLELNDSDDDSSENDSDTHRTFSINEEKIIPNSKCPGCVAPISLSGQILNSRTFNIVLETSNYTCANHCRIRQIEREYIRKIRHSVKKKRSNLWRFKKLMRNGNLDKMSANRTGMSVYDFVTSSESEFEGKLTPPLESSDSYSDTQSKKWSSNNGNPLRRQRIKYSEEELESLMQGVKQLGTRWNQILCTYAFHSSRTAVDLKEKYKRVMMQEKTGTATGKKAGRAYQPFSICEIRRLKRGVKKYGYNWKTILHCLPFSKGRNSQELRNKWRSMHRKGFAT